MSKKILYIGNKLSKLNRNETTIETLSSRLTELSYNVKSYSNQKSKLLRLLSMLSAILRHRYYDVVLIDTYSTSAFWFAWSGAKLCQFLNLDYIMILHGGNLPERLKTHNPQCVDIFSQAKLNISPSPYLYEVFNNQGFSNLKIIPNPLNIDAYKFKKRSKIQPKLLWVRAFADIYNPIMALEVLKNIRQIYPRAQLSMVGPFKDKSIDLCKTYAHQHQLPVEFTGKLPKAEWIKYSEQFDIFINTTNVDNIPLSVIEAMALGLAVVSTNVGGIPYLLKNNEDSLLVPPDNANEMYLAIKTLIENPELYKEMTKNARQKAEGFDWDKVKRKWLDVLE